MVTRHRHAFGLLAALAWTLAILAVGQPAPIGRVERDLTNATVSGVSLTLDVYYPAFRQGRAPVAVYVHGGGWTTMIADFFDRTVKVLPSARARRHLPLR